jgi:hypothetical protein
MVKRPIDHNNFVSVQGSKEKKIDELLNNYQPCGCTAKYYLEYVHWRLNVMKFKILSLSILAIGITTPVVAQQPQQCDKRPLVIERLSSKYAEVTIGAGVTSSGRLVELLASPDGATWTIIITNQGVSCLVGAGEGWRQYERTIIGTDT